MADWDDQSSEDDAASKGRLRAVALLDDAADRVAILASDGSVLWEPDADVGMAADLMGNPVRVCHPADRDALRATLTQVAAEVGSRATVRGRFPTSDGREWRWVELRFTNREDRPQVGGITASYRDVTDLYDQRLRDRATIDRLITGMGAVAAGVVILDAGGHIVWALPGTTVADADRDAGFHTPITDLVDPGYAAAVTEALARSLAIPGGSVSTVARINSPGGAGPEVAVELVNLTRDPAVGGVVMSWRTTPGVLQHTRQRLAALAAHHNGSVMFTNDRGRITWSNGEPAIGSSALELFSVADRPALRQAVHMVCAREESAQVRVRLAGGDGDSGGDWVTVDLEPAGPEEVLVTVATASVGEQGPTWGAMAPAGVWFVLRDSIVEYVTSALEDLTGGDFTGRDLPELLADGESARVLASLRAGIDVDVELTARGGALRLTFVPIPVDPIRTLVAVRPSSGEGSTGSAPIDARIPHVVVSPDGRFQANAVARQHFDLPAGTHPVRELLNAVEMTDTSGRTLEDFPVDRQIVGMTVRGVQHWCRVLNIAHSDNGRVVAMIDVTVDEQARQDARVEADRLTTALRFGDEGYALLSASGEILWTPDIGSVLGYTSNPAAGSSVFNVLVDEDREHAVNVFLELIATPGAQIRERLRFRTEDGGVGWMDVDLHNRVDDPEVQGVLVRWRDVTRQVTVEANLNETEQRLAELVAGSAEADLSRRQRLAELLHRDVVQGLTTARWTLESAAEEQDGDLRPAANAVLDTISGTVRSAKEFITALDVSAGVVEPLDAAVERIARVHGRQPIRVTGTAASRIDLTGDMLVVRTIEALIRSCGTGSPVDVTIDGGNGSVDIHVTGVAGAGFADLPGTIEVLAGAGGRLTVEPSAPDRFSGRAHIPLR